MAYGITNAPTNNAYFVFKYSGTYEITGEYKTTPTGYIVPKGDFDMKLKTSGTFTVKSARRAIDVFAVGGGGGARGWAWNDSVPQHASGGAGAGGCCRTLPSVVLTKRTDYAVTIGAGGSAGCGAGDDSRGWAGGDGGTTSAFGLSAPGGGGAPFDNNNGGTNADGTGAGAAGGWMIEYGNSGANGIYPFGESSYGYRYGAGGATTGSQTSGTPGANGAGVRAGSGAANSGSGGGGGVKTSASGGVSSGGAGGSGIVIIRNHRT